jgi:hypothetical protein
VVLISEIASNNFIMAPRFLLLDLNPLWTKNLGLVIVIVRNREHFLDLYHGENKIDLVKMSMMSAVY